MQSNQNAELVSHAIKKLLEEKREREASGDIFVEEVDDQLLLSRLLFQLESSKADGEPEQLEASIGEEPIDSCVEPGQADVRSERTDRLNSAISTEEIAKEIKHLKRQNNITHLLLSGLIMVTLAWQLSEVSVILGVKDRLSHPVRSFGSMLVGMLKGQPQANDQLPEKQPPPSIDEQNNHVETPAFKMPEVPHFDLKQLRFK